MYHHSIVASIGSALIHGAIYRVIWGITRGLGLVGTLAASAAILIIGALLTRLSRRR